MGGWRDGTKDPGKKRDRTREMLRRSKTAAESDYGLGGLKKEKGYQRRKPSMPTMPWEKAKDA